MLSCRSLREPFAPIKIYSIIADNYQNESYADDYFEVKAVSPKRS